jgi:hypothetical protein
MITKEQALDLFETTMIDCPLPSVADVLCAIGPNDLEAKIMFGFIKSHYTRKQMRAGIDEYMARVKLVNQLFSAKASPKK